MVLDQLSVQASSLEARSRLHSDTGVQIVTFGCGPTPRYYLPTRRFAMTGSDIVWWNQEWYAVQPVC